MKIYDFKNPDDFKELENQAYRGIIDYSSFPPAAYRYFSELTKLYADYRQKNISKSDAFNRKRKLLADYKTALNAYETWCSDHKERQEQIRKSELLMSDLMKADSLPEKYKISVHIIGLLTGDNSALKQYEQYERE